MASRSNHSATAPYRIWWLIAFCALGIGVAIEMEAPADNAAPRAQAAVTPGPVAAQARQPNGG